MSSQQGRYSPPITHIIRKAREEDHLLRPRIRTNSLDPGESSGRVPLYIDKPRTPEKPGRPIITREIEKPSNHRSGVGGAQLEASYIVPASSSSRHHVRHSSFTAHDPLPSREKDRDRLYPKPYLSVGNHSSRFGKGSHDDSSEYTLSRGHKDLAPPQQRFRRESRSGRPTSMIDLDRSDKVYTSVERDLPPSVSSRGFEGVSRKESLRKSSHVLDSDINHRDSLPRLYPKEERTDPRYRGLPKAHNNSREDYVAYPIEDSRHQRPRRPTIENDAPHNHRRTADKSTGEDTDRPHRHHHYHLDPGQTSENHGKRRYIRNESDDLEERSRRKEKDPAREHDRLREYDEDRHGEYQTNEERNLRRHRHEREHRRDRDGLDSQTDEALERPRRGGAESPSQLGSLAAGGTIAAASVASEGARKHRQKGEVAYSNKGVHGSHSDSEHDIPVGRAVVKPDIDEDREERRRRRRREREQEDYGRKGRLNDPTLYDEDRPEPLRIEAPPGSEQASRETMLYRSDAEAGERGHRRRHRHRRHRSPSRDTSPTSGRDDFSDSDASSDHIFRTPKVVSPPPINSAEVTASKSAPKGILKQPREKFPEDSSTLREGVAPLDAAKKGIPPEARWTRINRRLVNPESLEEEGIRFEEYPDYVIVLKVLSQDEIAKFTQRTHEIRERRRLEQGSQGSGSGNGTATANDGK